jgi:uracil-DNA glycosylase
VNAADLPAAFATLPAAWREVLDGWTPTHEAAIAAAVLKVSGQAPIAPDDPFRALRLVAPKAVKVLVFGQDPYPGEGHADGLAFSAPRSTRPSLRRVFDVLEADRPGWRRPSSGRLDAWAHQGVLLLNPTLSVEVGRANSHAACGWQSLTSRIAQAASRLPQPPIVLLWGSHAQAFWAETVAQDGGLQVLRTRHPSNDYHRAFMAEGSHFAATAQRVDWWALRD